METAPNLDEAKIFRSKSFFINMESNEFTSKHKRVQEYNKHALKTRRTAWKKRKVLGINCSFGSKKFPNFIGKMKQKVVSNTIDD